MDYELIEHACRGTGGSGEILISHHIERVPRQIGKDNERIAAEDSVDEEAHRACGALSLKDIGRLFDSLMLRAERKVVSLGHGLGEQIALYPVAVTASQEAELFLGLHALRNGLHMQSVSEGEDAFEHDAFFLVLAVVAEESFVYFQDICGDVLDELERGQTASEVVDSYLEARIPYRHYPVEDSFLVAYHRGFGYFHLYQRVRQFIPVHELGQPCREIGFLYVSAREIDRDRELRHGVLLYERLAGELGDIPVYVHDEVGFLRCRNEEERGYERAIGSYPADECLGAFYLTCYGVVLRLIISGQLVILQSGAYFFSCVFHFDSVLSLLILSL